MKQQKARKYYRLFRPQGKLRAAWRRAKANNHERWGKTIVLEKKKVEKKTRKSKKIIYVGRREDAARKLLLSQNDKERL